MTPDRVLSSVYAAIDEFNQSQPEDRQLDKRPETVLLGADSKIDSLGLVSLLVTVEQQLDTDFNTAVTLASDKAFSLRNSPFASVNSLSEYIASLLVEGANV